MRRWSRRGVVVLTLVAGSVVGCAGEDPYDWTGLWAGTYTEQQTNTSTGDTTSFGPEAVNARISSDRDGLFFNGPCGVPLRAESDVWLRVLPAPCGPTSRFDSYDVLSGTGLRTDLHMRMEIDGSAFGFGARWNIHDLFEFERTSP